MKISRLRALALTISVAAGAACSGSSPSKTETGTTSTSRSTSSSGTGTGSTDAGPSLGAPCSASSPCSGGLTCATSGTLFGRCTVACASQTDCETRFGIATAACLDLTQCAPTCTSAADCVANDVCTPLTSGNSVCIPDPDGPPDASLPNGACENLGGASGDSVVNGGYRCTPTGTASLGTSIDQCKDGQWVHGGDCTCMVVSSISGQEGSTDCYDDYEVPGATQCLNGVDPCLICSAAMGCTSE